MIDNELTELLGGIVTLPYELYYEAYAYLTDEAEYKGYGFEVKVLIISISDGDFYYSKMNDEWFMDHQGEMNDIDESADNVRDAAYRDIILTIFEGKKTSDQREMFD